MKKLLVLISALISLSTCSWASFGNIQSPNNGACAASTTCSVTASSTGAGHLLVAILLNGGVTQRTISSVSGGGSWVLCGATCQLHDVTCGCGVDAAWVLSSSSGATTITITASGTLSAASVQVYEFSYTGTVQLNSGATPRGTRDQTTNTTAPAGVTLTLSANNGLVIQAGYAGGTCSAVSASYVGIFPGGDCSSYLLNTTSGTAPTWTQTTGMAALIGFAFEETGGAGSPVRPPVIY